MFVGVVGVDGAFQVEAGGCGSQHHSAAIFLNARLQLLDLLGGLTDTYQKKAAGKRVERASVAYLEFLDAGEVADMPFQFVDNLKRCPADGLVYGDYGIQVNIDYRGRGRPRTKLEDDDGEADDGAVDGEPDEFTLLDDVDHPFACQATDNKGGDEADDDGEGADASEGGAYTLFGDILDVEQHLAEDGRNEHEERELSETLFLVAEEESGGDGGSRAREAGEDGDGLSNTDDEGVERRDFLSLTRFGEIAESQQGGGDE